MARPLHSLASRVRNPRRDDDSNASAAVYGWLEHCGEAILPTLKRFIDASTEIDPLDLASFGLALLGEDQDPDVPIDEPRRPPRPTCYRQAATYVEDLERLLAYQTQLPRWVLVRSHSPPHWAPPRHPLSPPLQDSRRCGRTAWRDPQMRGVLSRIHAEGSCPYRLDLFVDCGEDSRSGTAQLAEEAWAAQEDYLGRYVHAHIALRKLSEVAERVGPRGKALPSSTLEELAAVERDPRRDRLEEVFGDRIQDLLQQAKDDDEQRVQALMSEYRQLGLSNFRTYVGILTQLSERRWWNYHRQLLDYLFLKNTSHGFLRQPLGGRRRRRAGLTAGLLETLVLIAVVAPSDRGFERRPMRVDQFLDWLDQRYDILIATPPPDQADDPAAVAIATDNGDRFGAVSVRRDSLSTCQTRSSHRRSVANPPQE